MNNCSAASTWQASHQVARQAHRNLHLRFRLIGQRAAQDRPGIVSQQNIKLVLGRRDLDFQLRNHRGGTGHGGVSTVRFQLGRDAVNTPVIEDAITAGVGIGGSALNLQFLVQIEQLEIRGGDVADEGDGHAPARLIGSEILCLGSPAQLADAAPEINLPGGVEAHEGGTFRGTTGGDGRVIRAHSVRARHPRRNRFADKAATGRPWPRIELPPPARLLVGRHNCW